MASVASQSGVRAEGVYNTHMPSKPTLPPIHWIDTPQALQELAETLLAQPRVAVDTEANSLHAYHERVCLIQFSTPENDYLVDPLALDDLSPLAPFFASPRVEKIFHAAEYDILGLHRDFGFSFANLFDTMVSARILGMEKVGLGALLEQYFGVKAEKRYQRANWALRPLPPEMLDYARLDTHYLIPLRDILYRQLVERGLWELAREDFARLAIPIAGTGARPLWQRQRDLSPRQTATLKALWHWREKEAERRDVPPFKILGDRALVEVARAMPAHRGELANVAGLPRWALRRYGNALLAAVRNSKDSTLAPQEERREPNRPFIARYEALRRWRQRAAVEMGVPSDVVLPKTHMQAIAAANPSTLAELKPLMHDIPWRYAHFGEQILAALRAVAE